MNVKKEMLVDSIIEACEEKTKEPLTEEEKEDLTRFLKNRLRPRGENNYIFYTVHDHHRVYLDLKTPWTLDVVAEYALKFSK